MKEFIIKTICFSFVIIVIYIVQICFISWKVKQTVIPAESTKHILLLGDSHTECAINDTICSMLYNYSKGSDTSPISYFKIKKALADNLSIDTILISFSPLSIGVTADKFILNRNESLANTLPFWNFEDFILLPFPFNIVGLNYIFNTSSIKMAGGYLYLVRNKLNTDIERRKHLTEKPTGNKITLLYLKKIVDLCQCKNIKLIFINTPIYQASKYYDTDLYYKIYNEQFSEIELWDYMNMSFPDSCRGDINHLNYKGASIFSEHLKIRLNEDRR